MQTINLDTHPNLLAGATLKTFAELSHKLVQWQPNVERLYAKKSLLQTLYIRACQDRLLEDGDEAQFTIAGRPIEPHLT